MAGELESMDIINPPVKRINFNGEIVEISFVPMRLSLDAIKISDDVKNGKLSDYEGTEAMIEFVVKLCGKSNTNITRDWLLDNASSDMLLQFMETVSGGGKGESGKSKDKNGKN
jgi:hypothetical protein